MRVLRFGAVLVVALLTISAVLFTILTPETMSDPAAEEDVIERVQREEETYGNLAFRNVSTVGNRILVQADFTGNRAETPQESVEWHRLAEETAQRLYQDVVRNRGIEVQIYEEDNLRAVAVAGL